MITIKKQKHFLIDMDGVLIRGNTIVPGADRFIQRLMEHERKFLVLTNNSRFTPRDLSHHLMTIGLSIPPEQIFTSARATASFIKRQKPNGTAFVIGESGLTTAVHAADYIITEVNPDYVILGETTNYNFESLTKAIRLIAGGARFIATNPDPSGPSETGIVPGAGAVAALLERATGRKPFFLGKPNPFMMRTALNYLQVHSEDTMIIGDRMDTDVEAGLLSGMETILVLSGITRREDIQRFPYVPTQIIDSVADIELE